MLHVSSTWGRFISVLFHTLSKKFLLPGSRVALGGSVVGAERDNKVQLNSNKTSTVVQLNIMFCLHIFYRVI